MLQMDGYYLQKVHVDLLSLQIIIKYIRLYDNDLSFLIVTYSVTFLISFHF